MSTTPEGKSIPPPYPQSTMQQSTVGPQEHVWRSGQDANDTTILSRDPQAKSIQSYRQLEAYFETGQGDERFDTAPSNSADVLSKFDGMSEAQRKAVQQWLDAGKPESSLSRTPSNRAKTATITKSDSSSRQRSKTV